jgi:hypothetical protein
MASATTMRGSGKEAARKQGLLHLCSSRRWKRNRPPVWERRVRGEREGRGWAVREIMARATKRHGVSRSFPKVSETWPRGRHNTMLYVHGADAAHAEARCLCGGRQRSLLLCVSANRTANKSDETVADSASQAGTHVGSHGPWQIVRRAPCRETFFPPH